MGSERYMNSIHAHNHGVGHGDDTDEMEVESEGGESEQREVDPTTEPRTNLSQTLETFRNELNSCLMRSDYDYAMTDRFQNCTMKILGAMDGPTPMSHTQRVELFTTLGSCLESMADQVRIQYPMMADRYNSYGGQLRDMAHVN